jgi:hypothetical protein
VTGDLGTPEAAPAEPGPGDIEAEDATQQVNVSAEDVTEDAEDDAERDADESRRVAPGMAILVTVPFEIAKRLEAFLHGHGIVCEIQKVDTPAAPAPAGAKPMLSSEPYDSGMRHAAKNLLKIRSTPPKLPDLVVEKAPRPLYDVVVREEDLRLEGVEAAGDDPGVLEMVDGVAGELVVLCHLPWNEAWALAGRLTDAGIPAAAVPDPADEDRETALDQRIVPVAVRPEDLEAARTALER